MKKIARVLITNSLSLLLVSLILPTVSLDTLNLFISAGVTITLYDLLAKPIVSLLFLPVNLLTLGLLRWFPTTVGYYVTSLLVPTLVPRHLDIPAFALGQISLPPFHLGYLSSLILASFLFSFTRRLLRWATKPSDS